MYILNNFLNIIIITAKKYLYLKFGKIVQRKYKLLPHALLLAIKSTYDIRIILFIADIIKMFNRLLCVI